jgi:chromosome segregation ATPase
LIHAKNSNKTENEVIPEYLDVTQEAPRASGLGQVGIEQVVGEVETMQRQLYDLRAKFQKVQQENEALREKFQPDAGEQASNSGREGTFNASHRPYQAAERQVTNSSNDQGEQPWSAGADRSRECIHEQANRELQNTIQQLQTELAALEVEMAGLRQQKGALDSIIQIASGVLHSRRPDTQGSYEAARARSAQAAGRPPSVVGFKRRSIGDGHGSSGMPMGVAKRSRQATVESDSITE